MKKILALVFAVTALAATTAAEAQWVKSYKSHGTGASLEAQ